MRFEFATATRILFGPDTLAEVPTLVKAMGSHVFLVSGADGGRCEPLVVMFRGLGLVVTRFAIKSEPTTTKVLEAVAIAREANCDVVVAMGGGSVLDTGKIVAALLTNHDELQAYLEVIGGGKKIEAPPVPFVAIPTTAGTGAEVTRNAVVRSEEHRVKVSMRSPALLPAVAVVDPVLTYSLPPPVTASTGLDALTQLMEAFVSAKANPLTDGICREGLVRAARSLRRAYEDPMDTAAREDMALASLFGGLALANAKLGAVHGFAGPLGGCFSAPHGVICARLLPYVMEANVHALVSRGPDSSLPGPKAYAALERYDEVGRILTGSAAAEAAEGVAWVQKLCAALQVPTLTQLGIKDEDLPTLVPKAMRSSSMKGNPVALNEEELLAILTRAL